jgi:hypothetical protein
MTYPSLFVSASVALTVYVGAWSSYFLYKGYLISKSARGADERLRLYLTMLWNPFWRLIEREAFLAQEPEYRTAVTRLEISKYAVWLTIAIGAIVADTFRKL